MPGSALAGEQAAKSDDVWIIVAKKIFGKIAHIAYRLTLCVGEPQAGDLRPQVGEVGIVLFSL